MTAVLGGHEDMPEQLRTSWFSHVSDLADLKLQRKTWLDPKNRNPHWSYIEFHEKYPDDGQLSYALKRAWLTHSEFEILSKLRRSLRAYSPPHGNYYDNTAVLDDPAWQAVTEAAESARQLLLSMTADPDEREVLLGSK